MHISVTLLLLLYYSRDSAQNSWRWRLDENVCCVDFVVSCRLKNMLFWLWKALSLVIFFKKFLIFSKIRNSGLFSMFILWKCEFNADLCRCFCNLHIKTKHRFCNSLSERIAQLFGLRVGAKYKPLLSKFYF